MNRSQLIDPVQTKTVYSVRDTPWYFGAYLNMARNNVFLLINHLTEKFSHLGYSVLRDDGKIAADRNILTEIFNPTFAHLAEERSKVYKYLVARRYLPCIRIFGDSAGHVEDWGRLHQFIVSSLSKLSRLRNAFSHYLALDSRGDIIDTRTLNIDQELQNELEELFSRSPEYSLARFFSTQEEKDYEHLEFYKLFEERDSAMTEQGLYFFVNLFLERGYAIKFLKKIRGFKNDAIPAFKATLQAFTAYSLRVPEIKLDNDDPKFSLLMEVLSELQKCPKELYNHLSEEDRKVFEPVLDEGSKANVLLNSTDYESIKDDEIDQLLRELTTLKRHSNRFPYFALRCIDELNLLPRIRFQIAVGRLELTSYKKSVGGLEINRRLLKDINAFGKLSYFENKEEKIRAKFSRQLVGQTIIFDQFFPHYNIENNKIGFYRLRPNGDTKNDVKLPVITDKKKMNIVPEAFISVHDLPRLLLLALTSPEDAEKVIDDFLNQNRQIILNKQALQSLKSRLRLYPASFPRRRVDEKAISYKYLTKDGADRLLERKGLDLEKIGNLELVKKIQSNSSRKDREYLKQISYVHTLQQRKERLQQVLPAGLKVKYLPTRVQDHLLALKPVSGKKDFRDRMLEERKDIDQRLKQLDRQEPAAGQKIVKHGEVATFLARDIIKMIVKPEIKQRVTGAYYGRMQYALAYFKSSKIELTKIIEELALFDNTHGHVFLKASLIAEYEDLLAFYRAYLTAKRQWLNRVVLDGGKLRERLLRDRDRLPSHYRKHWDKAVKGDFDNWLANKRNMPVDLPYTLFDDTLNRTLKQRLLNQSIDFDDTDRFSVLLKKWLSDDTQPFYSLDRWYGDEEAKVRYRPGQYPHKRIKADLGTYAEKNEKEISAVESQDRILRIACERILEETGKISSLTIRLSNIYPNSCSNPLDAPVSFDCQTATGRTIKAADSPSRIAEVKKYLSMTDPSMREQFKGHTGYEWTLKDFGRFKRFVHDRRLAGIFAYLEPDYGTYDLLHFQLREYDRYREKIFELTFNLEQYLAENYLEEVKRKNSEEGDTAFNEVQFKIYLSILLEQGKISDEEYRLLKGIRNKYSHSEFPDYVDSIKMISEEAMNMFEERKYIKGGIEQLDLSVSSKLYLLYKNIVESCKSK